jgi:hypothetical protein
MFSTQIAASLFSPFDLYYSLSLSNFTTLWNLVDFFSFLILYIVGRTPWTKNQSVARPLPTHRTTLTQNKRTDIHALSGIRAHHPSVRAAENGPCLKPRGNCDRPTDIRVTKSKMDYG